ncbi:MAG: TetR family transcriptional regulator [Rhodospirillaceae bacterium]|jgi:TetR/AcrR family transcriptional regulator|nr:TetR family transcriptional regulator [Rhodospirillaceae bacterium]MBT3493911.1 TetR family transcriptional regulator [Rhodospirillaceae bacterium]MBT3780780.1 TetR family transcriptional regulator [Rhodospirillaceae bacterium]MBT3976207.1 TetR family transcriptional regulator [Rhodospirillaceae bacterium]MBT4167352.1 TetR family transcriptional regulator [Rhodospirillaceae bacterium]
MVSVNASTAKNKRDPQAAKERILQAALAEFSEKGLGGARVDHIAARAGANKRMLYHYFGNKDDLFLAVLEFAYSEIRNAELELNLDDLSPEEGMRRLVAFTFDYFIKAPYFINLLNSENLHQARHVRRSQAIVDMHGPVIGLITDVLNRGVAEGVFRSDADPVQVFITNASVAYFYFSNIYTLSTIIDRDLASEEELAARRRHVIDVVMGYLRPLDPAELLL